MRGCWAGRGRCGAGAGAARRRSRVFLCIQLPNFLLCVCAPRSEAEIAKKLEAADQRIAEYRARQHAPMREASLVDRLLLTPSQVRAKAKAV